VAVEGEPIAKGAERIAQGIIAAFETRQRVIILLVMAHLNRAERTQVIMDEAQDIVKAFARITDDLANLEKGEAQLERLETWDGLEMVVAIGRDERAGDGPIGEEAVINDIEALGLVAEVGFAPCGSGRSRFGGGARGGRCRGSCGLIRAGVVHKGGFGIAGSRQAAVHRTRLGVTRTAILALLASGTAALAGWEKATRVLKATQPVGARRHQLTVRGNTDALLG
jgi:hypothetical protein